MEYTTKHVDISDFITITKKNIKNHLLQINNIKNMHHKWV